mmetsp:Transcript_45564/g.146230  ORF Transcript_45564/g.146230 Transcript_45564/m.146230 type:complete len:314 (-) Transcript_45564:211-1152(-)
MEIGRGIADLPVDAEHSSATDAVLEQHHGQARQGLRQGPADEEDPFIGEGVAMQVQREVLQPRRKALRESTRTLGPHLHPGEAQMEHLQRRRQRSGQGPQARRRDAVVRHIQLQQPQSSREACRQGLRARRPDVVPGHVELQRLQIAAQSSAQRLGAGRAQRPVAHVGQCGAAACAELSRAQEPARSGNIATSTRNDQRLGVRCGQEARSRHPRDHAILDEPVLLSLHERVPLARRRPPVADVPERGLLGNAPSVAQLRIRAQQGLHLVVPLDHPGVLADLLWDKCHHGVADTLRRSLETMPGDDGPLQLQEI